MSMDRIGNLYLNPDCRFAQHYAQSTEKALRKGEQLKLNDMLTFEWAHINTCHECWYYQQVYNDLVSRQFFGAIWLEDTNPVPPESTRKGWRGRLG
jgi:hypothetical protein